MESLELLQTISILSSHVRELGELVVVLRDDPILRGKTLSRLHEQTLRLNLLISYVNLFAFYASLMLRCFLWAIIMNRALFVCNAGKK